MERPRLSRRFVLRGTAGAALAIPVLPSLFTPSEARAQAAVNQKIFVAIRAEHGGVWGANMFPGDASLTESTTYAGRTIRRGALASSVSGGVNTVSPVLRAPSSLFTDTLVRKMNVIRGIDIPFRMEHHYGGMLGNFGSGDGGGDGKTAQAWPSATIDQVMAWSPTFYNSLAGIRHRSFNGGEAVFSYTWSNPETRTGAITYTSHQSQSQPLFDAFFGGFVPAGPAPRKPIVDRVAESYRRLKNNPRLSGADRTRLDEHIQKVSEIERRLAVSAPSASCGSVVRPATNNYALKQVAGYPSDPDRHVAYHQATADVMVLALSCGLTRVATLAYSQWNNSFSNIMGLDGHFHQEVAHEANNATGQGLLVDMFQRFFEKQVLYVVSKMDGIPMGDGTTLLDRSLVCWVQEHGPTLHAAQSIPIIAFGGASGFLRTGNYVDYRNRALRLNANGTGESANTHFGLLAHQWFGTALQAMGVARSEYQQPDHNGYGKLFLVAGGWDQPNITTALAYPPATVAAAGDVLPYLRA